MAFTLDFPIVTARLRLRLFAPTDLDALHRIYARDDVARYLYTEPMTRAEATTQLEKRLGRTALTAEGGNLGLAVERQDTAGELIGDVMLFWADLENRQGEIAFVFHPDHHGQGFAREASEAVLRLGFDSYGLHRVVGRCEARNTASARLLARLGMRQEAHFRQNGFVKGEWTDELVYAILAEEWRASPRSAVDGRQ